MISWHIDISIDTADVRLPLLYDVLNDLKYAMDVNQIGHTWTEQTDHVPAES
jgi:hypothetical protein